MEQTVAKEFTCALDEHGRLKLLTLLSKAGLSFARVMNTQRIVTTDREGFVSNVDLTVAEVMDLEGLRLLGELVHIAKHSL